MSSRELGTIIIALGLAAVVLSGLVASGALGWFGRLPGDIRIESERVRIYAPLVSMLVISLAVSELLLGRPDRGESTRADPPAAVFFSRAFVSCAAFEGVR